MDIALLSMALNQGQVQQQASMAVIKRQWGMLSSKVKRCRN
ncbi:hypothetical protein [Alkalihalophilus pseudofirmus]